jgi:hypothetical protein
MLPEEANMSELTEEQRRALQNGKAENVTGPDTNEAYVVVGKEVYDRVRRLLYDDSDWTDNDLRMLLARSTKDNGWDEPEMEAYDPKCPDRLLAR